MLSYRKYKITIYKTINDNHFNANNTKTLISTIKNAKINVENIFLYAIILKRGDIDVE